MFGSTLSVLCLISDRLLLNKAKKKLYVIRMILCQQDMYLVIMDIVPCVQKYWDASLSDVMANIRVITKMG